MNYAELNALWDQVYADMTVSFERRRREAEAGLDPTPEKRDFCAELGDLAKMYKQQRRDALSKIRRHEFVRPGGGKRVCTEILAWRSRLDDCCGEPAPQDLLSVIVSAPTCIRQHGNADDVGHLNRLRALYDYAEQYSDKRASCSR